MRRMNYSLFWKSVGFVVLFFTGLSTAWYAMDGLAGSNIGHIYLIISIFIFVPTAYAAYRKKVVPRIHLAITLAAIIALSVPFYITSPIWASWDDTVQWIWVVHVWYESESGILMLLFPRDVILLDKGGITAYVGFDSYNLGNATVIPGMNGRTITLQVPDTLRDSLGPNMVIGIDHMAIGAADPHTIPNTMPPAIVVTTSLGG